MAFIREIVTHESPDLDAMTSIWLLQTFGKDKFPGVIGAELSFVPAQHDFGRSKEELLASGMLVVDVAGGHFDHHADERNNKCSSVLIAEHLGIQKEPSLQKILLFVNQVDTTGKFSATKPDPHLLLFSMIEMIRG